MASLTINTNLEQVMTNLGKSLETIFNNDYLLRPVAIEVLPMMTERIHQEGKASDGSQIGTYSNSYLKYREKNKRGSDPKVIVSLTRQLENDWSVLETPKGYGIGFTNSFNADKLRWVEDVKKKEIGALTQTEIDYAFERINELVSDAFSK
jgi:hypothetical protein